MDDLVTDARAVGERATNHNDIGEHITGAMALALGLVIGVGSGKFTPRAAQHRPVYF